MKIRLEIQKRHARGTKVTWEVELVDYLMPCEAWKIFKGDFLNPDKVWEELTKTNRVVYHRKEATTWIFEVCNKKRLKSFKR